MPRALVLSMMFVATTAWGPAFAKAPAAKQGGTSGPQGNPAGGAAIVAGKGKCLTCHRIRGAGSRSGPDLTDIGAVRNVEQIRTSLLDPDAEVLPENRSYRVVGADGTEVIGTLLNHDTFQVLMRDAKGQLRSFTKSELRQHGFVTGSPMPSYRSTLSDQELADLIAYLASLKGVVAE